MLNLSSAKAEVFFAACAWNRAPPNVHNDVLVEFNKSPHQGDAVIYLYKSELLNLAAACAGRDDISTNFIMNAIFHQAAMEATAAELKASLGIDRAQLDLAWDKEEAAAMCLLAESAPNYNITLEVDPPCKNRNAPLNFLRRFKVSRKTDPTNASRLIGYFLAKALAELDFMAFSTESSSRPLSKSPPAKPGPSKP
jgi:hypothetical protein